MIARHARAMLVPLVMAAAGVSPAVAQATPDAPEVIGIRFPGAAAFAPRELAAAIVSDPTRCPIPLCWIGVGRQRAHLDHVVVEADALRLRVFYYERGYRNTQVVPEVEPVRRGVRIHFRISEGRPIRVAELEVRGAPEEVRTGRLPLAPGQPFDFIAYEAGRDTLLGRLRNGGYARAQVLLAYTISDDDPYAATVGYDVHPGVAARIGEIAIEGNEATSPELVRRMLTFSEGDTYDRHALLESQRNLYGLHIFRHTEVVADLEAEPDTLIPITVKVAEGDMRRVRLGSGVNTLECANVDGRWTARNFLGGGRRLELRGRVGNVLIEQCQQLPFTPGINPIYRDLTGLVSADFTQPWFLGPRNSIGMGVFVERRSVPDVFVRSAVGGNVSLGRSLRGDTRISIGYRPELTELRTDGDLFFCVGFVACAFEDIRLLREPHWLSPLALSFSMGRTDVAFTPSSGFVLRGDLEHAGSYTGSDFAYTRLLGEGARYAGDHDGIVVAARLRGGIAWPHQAAGTGVLRLNPQKRFFAGGPNSVRGFANYRLGPTVLGVDATAWLAQVDSAGTSIVEGAGCGLESINDGTCDARPLEARIGVFDVRPAGGEVLLEGNLEVRFPTPIGNGRLRAAAFVDAGQVWATASSVALDELVITPGIGVRYHSPVGPIRFDAGFNTRGAVALPVLTTRVEACMRGEIGCRPVETEPRAWLRNTEDIVVLEQPVRYDPFGPIDSLAGFFRRFQLHFSIGQAF